jgi:tetratricopeptide (TPR) repeat protein
MADVPFVRGRVVWFYIIPQLILIFLLCWIFSLYTDDTFTFLFGLVSYWLIIFSLRNLVAKSHRKGIALLKKNNFEQAIVYFQKSVNFFEKNPWVDKYRYLTLLSASRMTYREMGLCNIAFSLSQSGRAAEAKEIYIQVLKQYPENGIATAALNMMQ